MAHISRLHTVSMADPTGMRVRGEGRFFFTPFVSSWDYFSIGVKVEWPLSLVFTNTIQRKYQLLFGTLIIWRGLAKKLGNCWSNPIGIRQFDRIRYAMQLFVAGYLSFTSTVIIQAKWSQMQNFIHGNSDIEDVFRIHEDTLDFAVKGFFLTDAKCVEFLTFIARSCSQFLQELKKWRVTMNRRRISREAKIRQGKPMITFFDVFEQKVQGFTQNLIALSNREADPMDIDFVSWINVNEAYAHLADLDF